MTVVEMKIPLPRKKYAKPTIETGFARVSRMKKGVTGSRQASAALKKVSGMAATKI